METALTPRQLAALAARRNLTAFSYAVYPPYLHAPHLALIDQALMQVARFIETRGAEGIGRLRIELPPRHGKSVKSARLFPAWLLGRNPDLRIILASHGAQLSEGHSRFVRNTLRSSTYASIFPAVRLSDDSAAREAWDLAHPHQGGLMAVGTGGSVTGRGGGLLLCDDLVKSREEVESAAAREKLWDWYVSDLLTRQEPAAAIVHIGTRWHVDDILGRLALSGGWHVITLPALAEESDPFGREPGAALWPERFNREALLQQQASMGDYAFQALYQQRPVNSAGGIFPRDGFRLVDNEPADIVKRVRYWDLALSEKRTADYTVGTLIGQTDNKRYAVLDVQRFRLSWPGVMDRIARTAQDDGPDVPIGIEQVLFSVAAITELLQRDDMSQFSVRGFEVHKDKLTRALPFAARVETGLVDVLRRSWTQNWIDEMCAFPNGKHDDQVDSASGAYGMVAASTMPLIMFLDAGPQTPDPWGEDFD